MSGFFQTMIAALQGRLMRLWKENSSFALAAGSGVIAPAIGLLTAPILTRLYSPAEFGVLGSFAAILASSLSVANLRYDAAVTLPKRDEEAYAMAIAAIRIGVAMSVVITLLFVGFGPMFFDAAMTKALMPNVWWLPIALGLAATTQVLTQFAVRRGAFGELATARLVQGVTGPSVQIGAGLAGWGVVGLLIGQAASQSGGLLRLWKSAQKIRSTFSSVPPARQLLKRYERFPRVSLLPAFVNALGLQLPVLIVAWLHGAAAAGMVLLVARVASPINILTTAGGQTLLADASQLQREHKSTMPAMHRTVRRQLFLNLPVALIIPFTPWIFPMAFGPRWAEAGRFAVLLFPAIVVQGVASPTFWLFDIHERQDIQLVRETIRVVTMVAAIAVTKQISDRPATIVGVLSAMMMANSALGYVLARHVVKADARKEVGILNVFEKS